MWIGNGVSSGSRSIVFGVGAALGVVGLGMSLSGCPVAAELENPDRFTVMTPGPVRCDQPLPDGPTVIGCNYDRLVRDHCARGGCHNPPGPNYTPAAQLNLTPDPLLIARILEVPSKHIVTCSGGLGRCNLTDPQCDDCRVCPTGDRDLLLTKTNVTDSWVIQKMAAFDVDMPSTVPDMRCGKAMPIAPGNLLPGGIPFDEERRTCLRNFFTWIANNGRPCDVSAAGSGAGGAGAGGAGSGGMGGT